MKSTFFALLFLVGTSCMAQDYTNAIGLRGGIGSGVTFKHNTGSLTYEALLSGRSDYFSLTGLVEKYMPWQVGERFYWYYGAGAHIGQSNGKKDNSDFNIGVDGIVGIEYVFGEIPFNIALDWKPEINIIGSSGFIGDGIAASLRYYW